MIYEPAEDSYLLQKWVKKYAKGKVLDVGTGSGIQALTALNNGCKVLAVDINVEAVEFVRNKGVDAIESDLFSNVSGKFDVIIFNPPYLPKSEDEDAESEVITTGGKEGFEILDKFLIEAGEHLEENGIILLVVSSLTGDVESLFLKHGFEYDKLDEEKIFFESLIVYQLHKTF